MSCQERWENLFWHSAPRFGKKTEDITNGTAGQTLIKAAGSAGDVSDGSIADFLLVVKGGKQNTERESQRGVPEGLLPMPQTLYLIVV